MFPAQLPARNCKQLQPALPQIKRTYVTEQWENFAFLKTTTIFWLVEHLKEQKNVLHCNLSNILQLTLSLQFEMKCLAVAYLA